MILSSGGELLVADSDIISGLHNREALKRFRAARDNVNNSPLDIVIYGNSITQGVQSTSLGGYPAYLGDLLTTEYGPNVIHGPGWVPPRQSLPQGPWVLTNTSGLSVNTQAHGAGLWALLLQAGDEVETDLTFDYLTVGYTQRPTSAGAGTLQVYIDDNLELSIATTNSALSSDTSHILELLGPFNEEEHNIRVVAQGAAVIFDGVFAHRGNQNSGIRVWNCGHSGHTIEEFITLGGLNALAIISTLQPALVITQTMFTERNNASFITDYSFWEAAISGVSPNSDIIFSSEYETSLWTTDGVWETKRDDLRDLSSLTGRAFLDTGRFFGSLGVEGVETDPCFLLRSDQAHPEEAGFDGFADIYFNFLTDHAPTNLCNDEPTPVPAGPFNAEPIKAVWAADPNWSNPGDGNAISSWPNLGSVSGDPVQATGANQPIYRASVATLNNEAAVDFDGANDYLYVALPGDVSHPYTMVAVVSCDVVDANQGILTIVSGGTGRRFGTNTTGSGKWQISTLVSSPDAVSDTALCIRGLADGANSKIFVNEQEIASGSIAGGIVLRAFGIGAYVDTTTLVASQFFNGKVAFAALYDKDLSGDPDWELDVELLAQQYGISSGEL